MGPAVGLRRVSYGRGARAAVDGQADDGRVDLAGDPISTAAAVA
ncbi:MAG: hypothetical protein ACRD1K_09950 [Acidimicrobiales bacterium]